MLLPFNKEWAAVSKQVEHLGRDLQDVRYLGFSGSSFVQSPYLLGGLIFRDSHHLNELAAHLYGCIAATQLQHVFDNP